MSLQLIPHCICGTEDSTVSIKNNIEVLTCTNCGTRRQRLYMNADQLAAFYASYPEHRDGYGIKREKNLETARARLKQYGTRFRARALDIGASDGAFVDAAREAGFEDSWGQELVSYEYSRNYTGPLPSINFPTDYFNTITMHDVLEHVVNPTMFLKEVFRITNQLGRIIIDFPEFDVPEGQHHWKPIEHLWFFAPDDLVRILRDIGYVPDTIERHVPGRFTIHAQKPPQSRTSILVAPGIGDSFWAIGKLESYCDKNNLGLPDVWISDLGDHKRSIEAVEKFPFLKAAGYRPGSTRSPIWQEAYMDHTRTGRTVFPGHNGCDYFIAVNGKLRHGLSMDTEIMPEYKMDWEPRMFRAKAEDWAMEDYRAKWGRYVVAYFVPFGMYTKWQAEFPIRDTVVALGRIAEQLKCKIVFSGANWDHDSTSMQFVNMQHNPHFIDYTGKTNYDQLLGLYRGSIGAIGYPSGSTIMSTVLRVPTLMIWNHYFPEGFWRNCCAPFALDKWYKIVGSNGLKADRLADMFTAFIEGA